MRQELDDEHSSLSKDFFHTAQGEILRSLDVHKNHIEHKIVEVVVQGEGIYRYYFGALSVIHGMLGLRNALVSTGVGSVDEKLNSLLFVARGNVDGSAIGYLVQQQVCCQ